MLQEVKSYVVPGKRGNGEYLRKIDRWQFLHIWISEISYFHIWISKISDI